jgi:hypothetical protein
VKSQKKQNKRKRGSSSKEEKVDDDDDDDVKVDKWRGRYLLILELVSVVYYIHHIR